jgi:hypothetical protein
MATITPWLIIHFLSVIRFDGDHDCKSKMMRMREMMLVMKIMMMINYPYTTLSSTLNSYYY